MENNLSIAIITVLYKSKTMLDDFVSGFPDYRNLKYCLFAYDNNSLDGSSEYLTTICQKKKIPLTLIKGDKNIGFAAANNVLLKLAIDQKFETVLFVNNDIIFKKNNIMTLIASCHINEKEVLSPSILFYENRKIWYNGGSFSKFKGISEHWNLNKYPDLNDCNSFLCDFAPMCFLLFPISIFSEIGLLDEDFFVYYEDVEFLKKATKQGWKVRVFPNIKILHKVSSSTGGDDSAFSVYHINRNRIVFLKKNYSFFSFIFYLAVFILSKFYKIILMNRNSRKIFFKAIIDGIKEPL